MSGKSGKKDEVVGRVKEAAGVVTDNEELEREGKADQVAGKIKQGAERVSDKVDEAVDRIRDRSDR